LRAAKVYREGFTEAMSHGLPDHYCKFFTGYDLLNCEEVSSQCSSIVEIPPPCLCHETHEQPIACTDMCPVSVCPECPEMPTSQCPTNMNANEIPISKSEMNIGFPTSFKLDINVKLKKDLFEIIASNAPHLLDSLINAKNSLVDETGEVIKDISDSDVLKSIFDTTKGSKSSFAPTSNQFQNKVDNYYNYSIVVPDTFKCEQCNCTICKNTTEMNAQEEINEKGIKKIFKGFEITMTNGTTFVYSYSFQPANAKILLNQLYQVAKHDFQTPNTLCRPKRNTLRFKREPVVERVFFDKPSLKVYYNKSDEKVEILQSEVFKPTRLIDAQLFNHPVMKDLEFPYDQISYNFLVDQNYTYRLYFDTNKVTPREFLTSFLMNRTMADELYSLLATSIAMPLEHRYNLIINDRNLVEKVHQRRLESYSASDIDIIPKVSLDTWFENKLKTADDEELKKIFSIIIRKMNVNNYEALAETFTAVSNTTIPLFVSSIISKSNITDIC
jgi:hypothetical protein